MRPDTQKQDTITYIYCSINDKRRQTTKALLAAIVRQLILSGGAEVHKQAQEFCKRHRFNLPQQDDLIKFILDSAKDTNNLFVVVDAVDELQSPQHFLDALSQLRGTPQVKVLTTTRPRHDLRWSVGKNSSSVISVQSSSADLLAYVNRRLDEVKPIKYNFDDSVKSQICQAIVAKSDNRYVPFFLQVSLQG
jgi:Cdc6-like AAA superfamily ATPase